MKSLLLIATGLAFALAISDIAQFRRIQNDSRRDCRLSRSDQMIERRCIGKRTLQDLYNDIPGGYSTVRSYAKPDFRKTLELCTERNDGSGNDWREIRRARGRLVTPAASQQWKDCDAQIKKEEKDCDNAMNLVCAFSQGTNFECASDRQFVRTAGTLENDQCFLFAAYVDGRPGDKREFRQRVLESRRDCRKDKEVIESKCRTERTMNQLIRSLPPGVNWWADIKKYTDLGKTVEKCLEREDYGWVQLRQEVTRTLRGGPNAQERKQCLDQLRDEERNDCAEAKKIVCAYTYGQDVSCASDSQKNQLGRSGPCDGILKAITSN